MARSGRCRCGTILQFELTARGYKTRCPRCQAIVRLRAEACPPPALPMQEETAPWVAVTAQRDGPPDFSALSEHESDAPIALAEMEAYNGPIPAPPAASSRHWWLLAAAVLVVLLAVGTLTALLSI